MSTPDSTRHITYDRPAHGWSGWRVTRFTDTCGVGGGWGELCIWWFTDEGEARAQYNALLKRFDSCFITMVPWTMNDALWKY